MKVIILSKLENLGNVGEIVKVKSGYARNFLIPNEKVILATKENIEKYKISKMVLQKKIEKKLELAKLRGKKIQKIGSLDIFCKASLEGKVFGSVTARDISKKLFSLGLEVNKKEIQLPKGSIKTLGQHSVIFKPHKEISMELKVNVFSIDNFKKNK
ncbi:50S ribosomal protein L9 [Buchnera aphidicola (Mindarus keteleerifoliae)]|uniref:50S ribosomal protein L9 n=1 Tax=Buchnera aphidicola TaxID=9 RepID=UPI0031B6A390